jgi:hypothetical protein
MESRTSLSFLLHFAMNLKLLLKSKNCNEILTHVTMKINQEAIALGDRTSPQKATYCLIPPIGNAQNGESIQTDTRLVAT